MEYVASQPLWMAIAAARYSRSNPSRYYVGQRCWLIALICLWCGTALSQQATPTDDETVVSVMQLGTGDAAENLFVALEALRKHGLLRFHGYVFDIPRVAKLTPSHMLNSQDETGRRKPWPRGIVTGDRANEFLCRVNQPHACTEQPALKWLVQRFPAGSRWSTDLSKGGDLDRFCNDQNRQDGAKQLSKAPWFYVLCLPDIAFEPIDDVKTIPFNPYAATEISLPHKILEQNNCPGTLEFTDGEDRQNRARKLWCKQLLHSVTLGDLKLHNGTAVTTELVRADCRRHAGNSYKQLGVTWCKQVALDLQEDHKQRGVLVRRIQKQVKVRVPVFAVQFSHEINKRDLPKLDIAVSDTRTALHVSGRESNFVFLHYRFSPGKTAQPRTSADSKTTSDRPAGCQPGQPCQCFSAFSDWLKRDGFGRETMSEISELGYMNSSLLVVENDFPLPKLKGTGPTPRSRLRILIDGGAARDQCELVTAPVSACKNLSQPINFKQWDVHASGVESILRGHLQEGQVGIFNNEVPIGFFKLNFETRDSPGISAALKPKGNCKPYNFSVFSMSLSETEPDETSPLRATVRRLADRLALVVVPAGQIEYGSASYHDCKKGDKNCQFKSFNSPNCSAFPACYGLSQPFLLTVVGLNAKNDEPLTEQRYGPQFDVAATGTAPVLIQGQLATFVGSSVSAPVVAALAWALRTKIDREYFYPDAAGIKRRIQFTSNPVPALPSKDGPSQPISRFGRIDFARALNFERDVVTVDGMQQPGFLRRQNGDKSIELSFEGVPDDGFQPVTETIKLADIRRMVRQSRGKSNSWFISYVASNRKVGDDRYDKNRLLTLRDARIIGTPPPIRMWDAQLESDGRYSLTKGKEDFQIPVEKISDFVACSFTMKTLMTAQKAEPDVQCDGAPP